MTVGIMTEKNTAHLEAALPPVVTKVLSTFRSLTIGNSAFSTKLCFLFTSVYLQLFLSITCQCSKLKKIIKNFPI